MRRNEPPLPLRLADVGSALSRTLKPLPRWKPPASVKYFSPGLICSA